jgi:hypothetical protein
MLLGPKYRALNTRLIGPSDFDAVNLYCSICWKRPIRAIGRNSTCRWGSFGPKV